MLACQQWKNEIAERTDYCNSIQWVYIMTNDSNSQLEFLVLLKVCKYVGKRPDFLNDWSLICLSSLILWSARETTRACSVKDSSLLVKGLKSTHFRTWVWLLYSLWQKKWEVDPEYSRMRANNRINIAFLDSEPALLDRRSGDNRYNRFNMCVTWDLYCAISSIASRSINNKRTSASIHQLFRKR